SLLQIMWQRKSLVILGIMLGLVLGLLYYAQRPPVYQPMAQLLVVKKTGTTDTPFGGRSDNRAAFMEDYMSTQSILIKSPEIINRAVKLRQMQDLKTFPTETGDELVYAIREGMIVDRNIKDGATGAPTNILSVGFR